MFPKPFSQEVYSNFRLPVTAEVEAVYPLNLLASSRIRVYIDASLANIEQVTLNLTTDALAANGVIAAIPEGVTLTLSTGTLETAGIKAAEVTLPSVMLNFAIGVLEGEARIRNGVVEIPGVFMQMRTSDLAAYSEGWFDPGISHSATWEDLSALEDTICTYTEV